jgi:hypothetical protein
MPAEGLRRRSRISGKKAQLAGADCDIDILLGYEHVGSAQNHRRSSKMAGIRRRLRRLKGRNVVVAFKTEILSHMRELTCTGAKPEGGHCPILCLCSVVSFSFEICRS